MSRVGGPLPLAGKIRDAHVVVAAVDEALQAIDQGVPDVLLSDVEMPGRDGYDLIGTLRVRQRACGRAGQAMA